MNPNSTNQWWSYWKFTVTPPVWRQLDFENVRSIYARFGRTTFGSATQMKVTEHMWEWVIEVRTEGHPVHDPNFAKNITAQWEAFFRHNFGKGVKVVTETKLQAGSRQDGTPAEQLIMLPSVAAVGGHDGA